VLSGGGLRGAGHIGVLQQLIAHDIPIDVIVGSSAGAVVAAYYAAVGLSLDEFEADALIFRGRHLIAHSLNVQLRGKFNHLLRRLSGVIPRRLEQLEAASFDRLHHGISALGIVCHDVVARRPCYFSTDDHHGARLSDVVRASASIPGLFPAIAVRCDDTVRHLSDGGVCDCVPVEFAKRPPLSATHIIVSDCRWLSGRRSASYENTVFIRPPLTRTGTLWASATLLEAVRQGAAAVTGDALARIADWYGEPRLRAT
jgi:NTE family protein